MIKINTGAPISAVTIPDSSSPGRPSTLPAVSAKRRRDAPQMADKGRIFRISGPISIRIRWGIISPTKPIGPARAVVEAHKRTPASAAAPRIRGTFSPRPVAASSPRARVFKEGARKILAANPMRKKDGFLPIRHRQCFQSARNGIDP